MSKLLFFIFLNILANYYISCERICEITPRKGSHSSRACTQSKKYEKIIQDEIKCEDICYVGDQPETNVSLF